MTSIDPPEPTSPERVLVSKILHFILHRRYFSRPAGRFRSPPGTKHRAGGPGEAVYPSRYHGGRRRRGPIETGVAVSLMIAGAVTEE